MSNVMGTHHKMSITIVTILVHTDVSTRLLEGLGET